MGRQARRSSPGHVVSVDVATTCQPPAVLSEIKNGSQRQQQSCLYEKVKQGSLSTVYVMTNMAKAGVGWQEKASPGKTGAEMQFTSGFSSVSRPKTTICLRKMFDPKPHPVKAPVRIRPPSHRPPPLREPVFGRSLSCNPPTKPIMRRRAQSLPSSTDRKKDPRSLQVRFVDSLGLELEDVKFFKVGEDPLIPPHVFSRLLMSSEQVSGKPLEISLPYFKPCFPDNMGAQSDFLKRLCSQRVCLEQVLCSELGIIGTTQVINLAFEKEVTVHYSFTNWRSGADTKASWVSTLRREESVGPESDIFRFRLPVPPFILQPGAILEFAICLRVTGCEYWDNNGGQNYKLSCHSYKLTVPKECEDSMVHFI